MIQRTLLGSLLVVLCLATLWGVWGQRRELVGLRAAQQQLLARLTAQEPTAVPESSTLSPTMAVTPELLRLRNDVTRLTERRRELASVRAENERLCAALGSRATNGAAQYWSSPGFVRKSEARMVGYNTPEDTLQTLLWAIHNRDVTNVLQAYMPLKAQYMLADLQTAPSDFERFWGDEAVSFGMRFVRGDLNPHTGALYMHGEMAPGLSGPYYFLRQTNGQWKIE